MKNIAGLEMPGEGKAQDTSLAGLQMIEPAPVRAVAAKKVERPDYRLPTKDEQIRAWEKLMFEMNMHRTITTNEAQLEVCLKRVDSFVNAHGKGLKGELTVDEIRKNVVQAFWENIAQTPAVGLMPIKETAAAKTAPAKKALAKKALVKKAPTKRKVVAKRTRKAAEK